MKQRVYTDTSVIGGCFDAEFSEWSNALLEEFQEGAKIAVVSNLTRLELEGAPQQVRDILGTVPEDFMENVSLGSEAEALADRYISEKVVASKHIVDARHIAVATVERVDVLASWNFKEMVNLDRIRAFNAVNLRMGYPMLEIRSPREVLHEKEI
ncbi:MAG: PIN domain protein [Elusimicrobia bacterium]|nr:PIN domain protein [Elusimicrobiota bacterium]